MLINSHTHKIDDTADINVLSFFHNQEIALVSDKVIKSCGIHPWHIEIADVELALNGIEQLCLLKSIKAIGECGLDALYPQLDKQVEIFKLQIELSEKYSLPLIIHSVKAHHLIYELRKSKAWSMPWVIHGFNGSYQMAQQLTKKGIYLSFGAQLLKNSEKVKTLIQQIDLNYMLFETDDANLSIIDVYKKAESLLDLQPELLEQQIQNNFNTIFST